MAATRKVEVFTADCPLCDETVEMVRRITCDSCAVTVLDLHDEAVAERAVALGVRSVPAVAIDGELARCCQAGGVNEGALRAQGVGRPLT